MVVYWSCPFLSQAQPGSTAVQTAAELEGISDEPFHLQPALCSFSLDTGQGSKSQRPEPSQDRPSSGPTVSHNNGISGWEFATPYHVYPIIPAAQEHRRHTLVTSWGTTPVREVAPCQQRSMRGLLMWSERAKETSPLPAEKGAQVPFVDLEQQ